VAPSIVLSVRQKMLKICITPLLAICSLHVLKIVEFYACIQTLPSKMQVGLSLAGPPCMCVTKASPPVIRSSQSQSYFMRRRRREIEWSVNFQKNHL